MGYPLSWCTHKGDDAKTCLPGWKGEAFSLGTLEKKCLFDDFLGPETDGGCGSGEQLLSSEHVIVGCQKITTYTPGKELTS